MYFQLSIKNIKASLLFLMFVPNIATAIGVDSIKANEFVSACQSSGQTPSTNKENANSANNELKINLCFAYLQGYFAGTDEIIAEESLPSSFTLRALRTRGARLNEDQQKLLDSRYCISEQESLKDIAAKVALLDANFPKDAAASEAVKLVLEQHYICNRS